jgi:hypothetical protein
VRSLVNVLTASDSVVHYTNCDEGRVILPEKVSSARTVYLNMKRVLPALQLTRDERRAMDAAKEADQLKVLRNLKAKFNERVERFFCERWSCSASALRKAVADTYPPERGFSYRANPQFFPDLEKYGGAKFTKAGLLVQASLGKGPDRLAYSDELNEYKDLRAAAKAERDKAA